MNTYRMHDVANAKTALRKTTGPKAQVAVLELEEDFWNISTRRTAGIDEEAETELRLREHHNG